MIRPQPRSLALVIVAALLGLAPSAHPVGPRQSAEEDGPGYPWKQIGEKKSQRIKEDVLGVWRLTSVQDPTFANTSRGVHGIALITDEHFAFEMHVQWYDAEEFVKDFEFQSGIHEMTLDATGNMVLQSLIGSELAVDGRVEFQPTGQKRVYAVDLRNNALTLTRPNGPSFSFVRVRGAGRNKYRYDIFGRRIPESEDSRPVPAPEEPDEE